MVPLSASITRVFLFIGSFCTLRTSVISTLLISISIVVMMISFPLIAPISTTLPSLTFSWWWGVISAALMVRVSISRWCVVFVFLASKLIQLLTFFRKLSFLRFQNLSKIFTCSSLPLFYHKLTNGFLCFFFWNAEIRDLSQIILIFKTVIFEILPFQMRYACKKFVPI